MSDPNLVTTYNFNNREYFIKMHVSKTNIELVVTDKLTGEDWQCCYDATYIENITQKTGNFKQFHIFTAMLKSGLLKTSNSVYLDLMTFEDLDALRNHRIRGPYSVYNSSQNNNNRRYLILTYTVEFDRIHYPLPLEYCGPPDPKILQKNIVKLEEEVTLLKEQIKGGFVSKTDSHTVSKLQSKIEELSEENIQLKNETTRLSGMVESKTKNHNYILMLQNAIKNLEQSVLSERKSHHKLVEKLRRDKIILTKELNRVKNSEKKLLNRLESKTVNRSRNFKRPENNGGKGDSRSPSPRLTKSESWEEQLSKRLSRSPRKRKSKSSSGSESGQEQTTKPSNTRIELTRPNSPSSRSTSTSRMSKKSTPRDLTPHKTPSRTSELDFTSLENRILALQKMLQKGLHIS